MATKNFQPDVSPSSPPGFFTEGLDGFPEQVLDLRVFNALFGRKLETGLSIRAKDG